MIAFIFDKNFEKKTINFDNYQNYLIYQSILIVVNTLNSMKIMREKNFRPILFINTDY